MKKLIFFGVFIFFVFARRGEAQNYGFKYIPFSGTNHHTGAEAWPEPSMEGWNPNASVSIVEWPAWQCWRGVDWNFHVIETNLTLLNNKTNGIVTSGRVAVWFTNHITLPSTGGSNWIGWFDHWAGADYILAEGRSIEILWSLNGVDWHGGGASLCTNIPVAIIAHVPAGPPAIVGTGNSTISNLTCYTMERPELFGTHWDMYGVQLMVSEARDRHGAVTKGYVDDLMNTTKWWDASSDVSLNGYDLDLSSTWSFSTEAGTNADECCLSWLGEDYFCLHAPKPANVKCFIGTSETNCLIYVPTNGIVTPPRMQSTPSLESIVWSWVDVLPTIVGTNYVFSVPHDQEKEFFISMVPSAVPGTFTLSSLLQLTPRTITNSADTTWGYGPGVVCCDSNYVYISVRTNGWKRAAFSSW